MVLTTEGAAVVIDEHRIQAVGTGAVVEGAVFHVKRVPGPADTVRVEPPCTRLDFRGR